MGVVELYRKHRPSKFSEIVGQDAVCKMLIDMGKRSAIPHCLLFSGPSGCGKTTLARILRKKLKCSDADFAERNCADFRGIDMVRQIRGRVSLAPMGGGKSRVWLIDEAHKLTGDAQNAFLKLLEDTPSHVYFFLATTEPQKLLKTIRSRATEIKVKLLSQSDMGKLLHDVLDKESYESVANGKKLPLDDLNMGEEVLNKIIEVAEGSPRKALVLLNQVIGLKDEQEQVDVVSADLASRQAIELARMLIKPKAKWAVVAKLLKEIEEEPESLRWMILGYCSAVLLGGGGLANRAFKIIDIFRENFYDSKKAGLVAACYEAVTID